MVITVRLDESGKLRAEIQEEGTLPQPVITTPLGVGEEDTSMQQPIEGVASDAGGAPELDTLSEDPQEDEAYQVESGNLAEDIADVAELEGTAAMDGGASPID